MRECQTKVTVLHYKDTEEVNINIKANQKLLAFNYINDRIIAHFKNSGHLSYEFSITEENYHSSITSLKQLQYEEQTDKKITGLDLTSILSNINLEDLFTITVSEAKKTNERNKIFSHIVTYMLGSVLLGEDH